MNSINKYFEEVQKKYKTGHAREHAYRPALEQLIESLDPSINAVNDPKQQKVGAPDFVILKEKTPVGYIEAKDIDVDLDKEIKNRNQVNRYKSSFNNLCFTNYLEFRFYVNGEEVEKIVAAKLVGKYIEIDEEKLALLQSVLRNFIQQKAVTINSPKELAKLMAEKAKMLKNTIFLSLKDEEIKDGEVEKQYDVFKEMLIHDLSQEQFADIYAQTVAYGMFAARYHDPTIENFTRDEANTLLPKSNPFLRNFFQSIAGYNIDKRIVWMVDDLAELFNHVDVRDLLENYGKHKKRDDVIIHFYETFLAEYDKKLRKSRGVYYTPEPVVDFMVRAVDDILKKEFGIKDGIADTEKIDVLKEEPGKKRKTKVKEHRVQILDPATGTGTFLDKIIKHIYNTRFKGQDGLWQSYVDEHLLPRLHGFEILMASYAMAHLKIDITLAETGYDESKGSGKRLGVYLTNSLEEPEQIQRDLFSQWLSSESLEANEVKKEKPIMVVMGNPPYSGISSNNGEWIANLIEDYKYVDGKHFGERKHWLQDDYVKFIRFAEWFIEKNGEGVVAYINNHSFIDNQTFRGMRNHLLNTFDKIFIFDLHGNSKSNKKPPSGSKDENVFDIMQGVSINIFIKNKLLNTKKTKVYQYDLYGERSYKYNSLKELKFNLINWQEVKPRSPNYFFVAKDYTRLHEYNKLPILTNLFIQSSTGIVTGIDRLSIFKTPEELINTTKKILESDDPYLKFNIKDTRKAKKEDRLVDLKEATRRGVKKISYRPFDENYMYLPIKSEIWINSPRYNLMKNFLLGENVGLVASRQCSSDWRYTFLTKNINEFNLTGTAGKYGAGSTFPLYLYVDVSLESSTRQHNLNQDLVDQIAKKLSLQFIPDHEHKDAGKKDTFHPLDILDYIYAILHSPIYRERYKEFLKIDFPRVPFTSNQKLFWKLVKKGREIREYHLMEHKKSSDLITAFPVTGENEVSRKMTKISPGFELTDDKKKLGKVWINDMQYFDKVPEVAWNFYIGGYQPAQKWLKDRKERKLSFDDILHYQKIIVALTNTDRLMKEIDEIIPKFPIK